MPIDHPIVRVRARIRSTEGRTRGARLRKKTVFTERRRAERGHLRNVYVVGVWITWKEVRPKRGRLGQPHAKVERWVDE